MGDPLIMFSPESNSQFSSFVQTSSSGKLPSQRSLAIIMICYFPLIQTSIPFPLFCIAHACVFLSCIDESSASTLLCCFWAFGLLIFSDVRLFRIPDFSQTKWHYQYCDCYLIMNILFSGSCKTVTYPWF